MTLVHIYFVLFWSWTATEGWLQLSAHTRAAKGERRDGGSLLPLVLSIVASVWFALQYGLEHAHVLPFSVSMPLALALVGVGLVVRWVAVLTLGRAFSTNVAIRSGQQLCQRGLYRWLRHPSYTGMLLCIWSVGIFTRNAEALAVVLVVPTIALHYRIRVEEAVLRQAFGGAYSDYCQRTRRLIPFIY